MRGPRVSRRLAFPALAVVALAVVLWPSLERGAEAGASVSLTVDGSQEFQTIDGFGVNANPKNWNGGELIPAIDMLVDDLGATIWRVDIFGESDWEAVNDDADPSNFNWAYYNTIYESPDFQELWNTLAYLNQKDVQILLTGSGVVPDWMGGSVINTDKEDEYVELIASVVYYGRNVRNVQFTLLSPLNETNLGPPEGPLVDPTQYARLIKKLVLRLDELGFGDVEIVAPDSSNIATEYLPPLFADSTIMERINHFAFHNYVGWTGDAQQVIENSAYPDRNFWLTEWSQAQTDGYLDGGASVADEWAFARLMTDFLMNHLRDGAAAALAWDGYDNVHDHDPSGQISRWGLLEYDESSGTYAPKKRFYTNAHVFRFVPPGSVRIGSSVSSQDVQAYAFREPSSGLVTIVGQNFSASPVTLAGTLNGVSGVDTFELYVTNENVDLQRQSDVPVAAGSFSAPVPGDSFFTLTSGGPPIPPTPTPTPLGGATPTATPPGGATPTPPEGATPTPTAQPMLALTFDDLPGENQVLNGEYPAGVVDWGADLWWHSEPWGALTTKNVTFNGPGIESASFTLLEPRSLVQLDAYNGGPPTTVTLSCPGQANTVVALASGQLAAIQTGWSGTCASVTIASTNGWDTNFDNLVLAGGGVIPGPDTDGDGCTDAAELQTAPGSESFGGRRDPNNFWDFVDMPTGLALERNRRVSGPDLATVVLRFGASDVGVGEFSRDDEPLSAPNVAVSPSNSRRNYHPAFDRSGSEGPNPWNALAANGNIVGTDIATVVLQFGHTCV